MNLIALEGLAEVRSGDDLAALVLDALDRNQLSLQTDDVVVLAQKIVSKSEGRTVALADVVPSARAAELAAITHKDPRVVELIVAESASVLRAVRDVLIVEHRLGHVMANAGIDHSNVAGNASGSDEYALLLPVDPEASCQRLRAALKAQTGVDVAVVVNDSFGRAWRNGTVGVALGCAGLPALVDLRGQPDRFGRPLHRSQLALADELAAAASLVMGQGAEGCPVVLARGVPHGRREGSVRELMRPMSQDLFR